MSGFTPIGDGRDWARKIMARHEYSQKINRYTLSCAFEALGLPPPKSAPKKTNTTTSKDRHEALTQ